MPFALFNGPLRSMLALFLTSICLMASGCAQMSIPVFSTKMTPVHYPECYQPCLDLEASYEAMEKSVLTGAFVGAAAGVATGLVATGDPRVALATGVGGAAIGAMSGYAVARMKQISDDDERFASYQLDMNSDYAHASRVEMYAYASMQCYLREFETLTTQYKQGGMTKEEFTARYLEIKEGLTQLSELTEKARETLRQNDEKYREAFAMESEAKNKKAPTVASLDDRQKQVDQADAREISRQKKRQKKSGKRPPKGSPQEQIQNLASDIDARKVLAEKRAKETEKLIPAERPDTSLTSAFSSGSSSAKKEPAASSSPSKSSPKSSKSSVTVDSLAKNYEKNCLAQTTRVAKTSSVVTQLVAATDEYVRDMGIDV